MPNYRMSYFYESIDNEGWTDNFYYTTTTISSALTAMDLLFTALLGVRMNGFKIVNARVSDVAVRGSVQFTSHSLPALGTYVPSAGGVRLEANVALVQQILSTAPHFMRWYLRGLTSDVIVGREKVVNAGWDTAFNNVITQLLGGGFQSRHRLTPPPHATYSYFPLSVKGETLVSARKPGRPFDLLVGRRTHLK